MKRTIAAGLLLIALTACGTEKVPLAVAPVAPAATEITASTPPPQASAPEHVPPMVTRTLNGGPLPKSECNKDEDCKSTERCSMPTCHEMRRECMGSKCVPK